MIFLTVNFTSHSWYYDVISVRKWCSCRSNSFLHASSINRRKSYDILKSRFYCTNNKELLLWWSTRCKSFWDSLGARPDRKHCNIVSCCMIIADVGRGRTLQYTQWNRKRRARLPHNAQSASPAYYRLQYSRERQVAKTWKRLRQRQPLKDHDQLIITKASRADPCVPSCRQKWKLSTKAATFSEHGGRTPNNAGRPPVKLEKKSSHQCDTFWKMWFLFHFSVNLAQCA